MICTVCARAGYVHLQHSFTYCINYCLKNPLLLYLWFGLSLARANSRPLLPFLDCSIFVVSRARRPNATHSMHSHQVFVNCNVIARLRCAAIACCLLKGDCGFFTARISLLCVLFFRSFILSTVCVEFGSTVLR